MSGSRAYFYLGGEPIHAGIYADLLARLAGEGIVASLVARRRVRHPLELWRRSPEPERIGPNRIEDLRARVPGGVHVLPVWNLDPSLSASALERLMPARSSSATVVFHTRQVVMARLALAMRRRRPDTRVLVEFEGDDLAEIDYRAAREPAAGPVRRALRGIERAYYDRVYRRILREADGAVCVSARLREVLIARYGLGAERANRLHVMPTLASRAAFRFDPEARARVRREAGWEDRFVVLFSGNLRSPWQVPGRLVEAFRVIRAGRADALFVILAADPADRVHVEPALRAAGIAERDWTIRTVPHREVAAHLCAADVGLLLRERHPMNEVAAPGKFGEYVLTGLPILMTEGIGDFSAEMRSSPQACVLPGLDDVPALAGRIAAFCSTRPTDEQRAGYAEWAAGRFAVETMVPRLARLYREL